MSSCPSRVAANTASGIRRRKIAAILDHIIVRLLARVSGPCSTRHSPEAYQERRVHARQVNTWKPRRKLQIHFSVLRRLQDSFAPGTARRFRTMSPRNEQSSDKAQTVRYITHVIANIFGPSTMVAGLLLKSPGELHGSRLAGPTLRSARHSLCAVALVCGVAGAIGRDWAERRRIRAC